MPCRKINGLFFFIILAFIMILPVSANDAEYVNTTLYSSGFDSPALLNDGSQRTFTTTSTGGSVTLTRTDGISSLYVVFQKIPTEWTISDGEQTITCGKNAFLHEFVDVASLFEKKPTTLTLSFPVGTSIDEIYGFSSGKLPDWVQIWLPPCEKADILLISSHSDDEQLFFAGVLPTYAGERGLAVQVVYLVHHFETNSRPHEQLDGLWTVGVKNYPIISNFPDLYSESLDAAITSYGWYGYSYDDFCRYITDSLRRFRPQVVVTHDVNGEYGHGTHILCTAALRDSLVYTSDENVYPESAAKYGTWDVPKTYLHLYNENKIVMDFDVPLEAFGGKTAFQVSQDGFACHESQHWTWFYGWLHGNSTPITKASQIAYYSPCQYGLYRTTVGADVIGGDFFENMKSYADQEAERLAAEKAEEERKRAESEAAAKAEEERKRAESEAAAKAEEESRRAESEAAAKAEEESRRIESEAAEKIEKESTNDNEKDKEKRELPTIMVVFLCSIILMILISTISYATLQIKWKKQRKRNSRRQK